MVVSGQRYVHTLINPLGYGSPCAPLIWCQWFPTLLGGSSIPTDCATPIYLVVFGLYLPSSPHLSTILLFYSCSP